jgi:hypothetical protein
MEERLSKEVFILSDFELKLYAKCKEQFPDMTTEEFDDALAKWVWQKEKERQIKDFQNK